MPEKTVSSKMVSKRKHSRNSSVARDAMPEQMRRWISLGHWIGGLRSFVSGGEISSRAGRSIASSSADFELAHRALLRISKLALETDRFHDAEPPAPVESGDLAKIIEAVRKEAIIGGQLLRAGKIEPGSWEVWRAAVRSMLSAEPAFGRVNKASEIVSTVTLPEKVKVLADSGTLPQKWTPDVRAILPRIAAVKTYLGLISEMLEDDRPLKDSILLFRRVDDLLRDLMKFINNRLERFPDDTDALFGSLDAAGYTASIELKKVRTNELAGLSEIRPSPLVFARVETAYSLLTDSLQMTLVNLAQLADRDLEPTDIFPDLLTKEQQSIQLRENMWHLLQIVQKTEQDPDSCPVDDLKRELLSFRDKNLYFLFYKDMETVERFIQEVVITSDKKDLVPLLHRFGAYLETLLGQVNMRAVLANHPFKPLQVEAHPFMPESIAS